MRKSLLSIIALIATINTHAVNDEGESEPIRPVYASYALKAGNSHRADTYLSPIKYSGWQTGFLYERIQAMKFNPENWVMQLKLGIDLDCTTNLVGNSDMWFAGVNASWGMMRRWKLPCGFSTGIGPAIGLNAGCLYLERNGNNPASAKVSLTADASGYIAWNGSLLNIPLTVRYEGRLPVIGAFFSPDYGELYYEIYLGNHSGLAHCAWWGNYIRYDHQLTADLHFGSTSLRIGYCGQLFSSKVNDIVTRTFSHGAIIGISGEWISLNPTKKLSREARVINATY